MFSGCHSDKSLTNTLKETHWSKGTLQDVCSKIGAVDAIFLAGDIEKRLDANTFDVGIVSQRIIEQILAEIKLAKSQQYSGMPNQTLAFHFNDGTGIYVYMEYNPDLGIVFGPNFESAELYRTFSRLGFIKNYESDLENVHWSQGILQQVIARSQIVTPQAIYFASNVQSKLDANTVELAVTSPQKIRQLMAGLNEIKLADSGTTLPSNLGTYAIGFRTGKNTGVYIRCEIDFNKKIIQGNHFQSPELFKLLSEWCFLKTQ
jgi:hypothetical protein